MFEKNQSCEAKQFVEVEEDVKLHREGAQYMFEAEDGENLLTRLQDQIRRCVRSLMSYDEGNLRLFDLQSTVYGCCYRLCDLLEVFGFFPAPRASLFSTLLSCS